jgi:NET1-associated nuclear protein 1 (U3 small nucleolar RNA-associated protein 17)
MMLFMMQLYTGSLDKTVRLWDYAQAATLKVIDLGSPVLNLLFLPGLTATFLWLSDLPPKKEGGNPRHQIRRHVVAGGSSGGGEGSAGTAAMAVKKKKNKPLCRNNHGHYWTASPQGSLLCCAEEKKLVVFFLDAEGGTTKEKYLNDSKITAVAVHPTENCIATGDRQGRIVLWQDVISGGDSSSPPIRTVLHWHAHGVADLAFNSDGSYLLSGGEEAVLVIWQVATGNQRFLPRLGAPITGVAVSADDTVYATCHSDNTVRVVDALSLEQRQAVCGLRRAPVGDAAHSIKCGMATLPGDDRVVLNGAVGSLQVFNCFTDRLEREYQVVDRVYLSRTHGERVVNTTVDHVTFTKDGHWMATVESRDDTVTAEQVRLKFWQLRTGSMEYTLVTTVDPVHRAAVTSLSASPSERMVATTSLDRRFKVWTFRGDALGRQASSWHCLYVGSYIDMPCISSHFSFDGSLLNVTCGQNVTLWNPATTEMLKVLTSPTLEPLRGAVFTPSQYLVSFSAIHLTVWNLLTCTGEWLAFSLCARSCRYLACRMCYCDNKSSCVFVNPLLTLHFLCWSNEDLTLALNEWELRDPL